METSTSTNTLNINGQVWPNLNYFIKFRGCHYDLTKSIMISFQKLLQDS